MNLARYGDWISCTRTMFDVDVYTCRSRLRTRVFPVHPPQTVALLPVNGSPIVAYLYNGVHNENSGMHDYDFWNWRHYQFKPRNFQYSEIDRLLRSKCLPSLLYCVEACHLFERDKHSFDFSLTRIFMKLFRTGSVDIVTEYQKCSTFYLWSTK